MKTYTIEDVNTQGLISIATSAVQALEKQGVDVATLLAEHYNGNLRLMSFANDESFDVVSTSSKGDTVLENVATLVRLVEVIMPFVKAYEQIEEKLSTLQGIQKAHFETVTSIHESMGDMLYFLEMLARQDPDYIPVASIHPVGEKNKMTKSAIIHQAKEIVYAFMYGEDGPSDEDDTPEEDYEGKVDGYTPMFPEAAPKTFYVHVGEKKIQKPNGEVLDGSMPEALALAGDGDKIQVLGEKLMMVSDPDPYNFGAEEEDLPEDDIPF